jgi:acyl-CoA hydrolase
MNQLPKNFIEKMQSSETTIVKMVFPEMANHYETLFGGTALKWMDEIAFISATRFCRKTVVTVSTDKIDFKKPIPTGSLVELKARVTKVGKSSMIVHVQIFQENLFNDNKTLALQGDFTMVALGANKKPASILE